MEDEVREVFPGAEEAGFQVTEPVPIDDLDGVKQSRTVVPPADGTVLVLRKATPGASKDNSYRWLNISFAIRDGILVPTTDDDGNVTGEEVRYKGSVIFHRVCYYADPEKYITNNKKATSKEFFEKRQHLLELQALSKALGMTISRVDDALLEELSNKEVVADIRQKNEKFTAKDGTEVETTRNYLARLRAIPADAEV